MNAAIILVAGRSSRFDAEVSKQVYLLGKSPVFSYSLETFSKCKLIEKVILVTDKEHIDEIGQYVTKTSMKNVKVVLGGETRQQSVECGLAELTSLKDEDIVIIHDGARPLIDEETIEATLQAVKKYDAVTTFINTEDTICVADGNNSILEFIDRRKLMRIQTPQAFKYHLIRDAHKYAGTASATDDCSLVMSLPHSVKLIPGSKKLTKLTTIEDAKYLETFIK